MQWVLQITLLVIAALVVGLALANWKKILGWGGLFRGFVREVIVEMKKVSWPSREEIINSTLVVGVATACLVVLIGAADWVLGQFVASIFMLKK